MDVGQEGEGQYGIACATKHLARCWAATVLPFDILKHNTARQCDETSNCASCVLCVLITKPSLRRLNAHGE